MVTVTPETAAILMDTAAGKRLAELLGEIVEAFAKLQAEHPQTLQVAQLLAALRPDEAEPFVERFEAGVVFESKHDLVTGEVTQTVNGEPAERPMIEQLRDSVAGVKAARELLCMCGHAMVKHPKTFARVGQQERGGCTQCACRTFRQTATTGRSGHGGDERAD